jgi:phenylacetate-CoA ligase
MWQSVRLLGQIVRQKWALRGGRDGVLDLQRQRLKSLVAHAKERSPYYAERLRDVDPERFDLRDLPTLTKTQMMENFDRFLTVRDLTKAELEAFVGDPDRLGEWYRGEYALSRTSGTQGLKALIVQDRPMMELLFALQIGRGSVFPINPATVVARLFSRARLAAVTIGRGFYPSASGLAYQPEGAERFVNRLWLKNIEPIEEAVAKLNEFQPHVLLAYANVLEILAREELAGRMRLSNPGSLRQIINMSEPLGDGAKRLVRDAFGLPITDNYATGECMALSTGCPDGHGMHLQADWVILEVVDRHDNPVEDGKPGDKVLVTNLYNTIQPFIRYEVDDVVTMSPAPCPCVSPLPLIKKVDGRKDEVVWIRDGDRFRQIHPYVFVDVLDERPEVGWYQIIQEDRNRFRLRASPAPERNLTRSDLQGIMDRGLRRFGLADLVEFDVEVSDDVAPDIMSGKLKRIMSRIGPPEDASRMDAAPTVLSKAP